MSADLMIPESIQHIVRDLVTETMYFDESAEYGGSWLELYTWLIRMQAKLDTLLEIGPDGIRRGDGGGHVSLESSGSSVRSS